MPPIDTVLTRHCLKLRKPPIEWIAAHGLQQLCGRVHNLNDTAGNITVQAMATFEFVIDISDEILC